VIVNVEHLINVTLLVKIGITILIVNLAISKDLCFRWLYKTTYHFWLFDQNMSCPKIISYL